MTGPLDWLLVGIVCAPIIGAYIAWIAEAIGRRHS